MNLKTQDLSKSLKGYSSKWIALKPQTTKVVAVGSSPRIVIEKARENGVDSPVLTRVPKNYGTYIL
jgi:hypothetical protein